MIEEETAAPVGVLGGTFDPVHLGHLGMAETIRLRLVLSRMLLVLSPRPPHKRPEQLSSAQHREAMLTLALHDRPELELCRVELERSGVGFTIDTLRELRDEHAVAPVFILGMDALVELPTWKDPEAMLSEFDLVAVDRPGADLEAVRSRLARPIARRVVEIPIERPEALRPGSGGRVIHFPMEPIPISSSAVRTRARAGEDLTDLVPSAVAGYIQKVGLYRTEANH